MQLQANVDWSWLGRGLTMHLSHLILSLIAHVPFECIWNTLGFVQLGGFRVVRSLRRQIRTSVQLKSHVIVLPSPLDSNSQLQGEKGMDPHYHGMDLKITI